MPFNEQKPRAPIFARMLLVVVSAISLAAPASRAMDHVEVSGFAHATHESQQASQWCWAASIEAVLSQYGIERSQPQIVMQTYGVVQNQPLRNPADLAHLLNDMKVTKYGAIERVTAQLGQGAPPPAVLLEELQTGHPVIILYMNPTGNGGHCVVLYGADFVQTPTGPSIQSLQYFDPWPGRGNQTVEAGPFAQSMNYFIVVRGTKG